METSEAIISAAHLPTVGPARLSQRVPGLGGKPVTFVAGDEVDAIGSTIPPPIAPSIAKSTRTAIRKRVEFVIGGRRASPDEVSIHAVEVRFRATLDRSKRLEPLTD